jgi:hypothetical protein
VLVYSGKFVYGSDIVPTMQFKTETECNKVLTLMKDIQRTESDVKSNAFCKKVDN